MVAGYSGLGKTSFIRTLFGTLKLRSSTSGSLRNKASLANLNGTSTPSTAAAVTDVDKASALGTKANGTKDSIGYVTGELVRTLNSFEALFEIEESSDKINLTLVDTPGFLGGDDIVDTHCDEILAYLEYQFDLTLAEVRNPQKRTTIKDRGETIGGRKRQRVVQLSFFYHFTLCPFISSGARAC